VIYAIQAGDQAIKFGIANSPIQRRCNLQTANHLPLVLLASQPSANDEALETKIHDVCKTDRIRGEWFGITDRTLRVVGLIQLGMADQCHRLDDRSLLQEEAMRIVDDYRQACRKQPLIDLLHAAQAIAAKKAIKRPPLGTFAIKRRA
jgi:hypothetical protein